MLSGDGMAPSWKTIHNPIAWTGRWGLQDMLGRCHSLPFSA